jgi:hypothetical protein
MAFRASDAGIFVQDGELAMLADSTSFRVNLEYPEEVENFSGQSRMGQVAGHPRIVYATAAAPKLKSGDTVTVDGVSYKVQWSKQLDDGVMSSAELKKG